jgi:hypothetical protein
LIDFQLGAASVLGIFALFWMIALRKWRKQQQLLLAKRANPSKAQFVETLGEDADPDVAEWLWHELIVYLRPHLAPHPNDHLLDDLRIDPGDPEDWLREFCNRNGLAYKDFPGWPADRQLTVRNLAIWLSAQRHLMRGS